jgi:hypothetical protein
MNKTQRNTNNEFERKIQLVEEKCMHNPLNLYIYNFLH